MRSLFKKYPVTGFISLTFLISYLIGLPLKIFFLNTLFRCNEVLLNTTSQIMVVFGPALSALIMTFVLMGKQGVYKLLGKLKPDTRYLLWYIALPLAAAIFIIPVFTINGVHMAEIIAIICKYPGQLIMYFISSTLIIGTGEELGWRGWLLPQLAKNRQLITATLLVFITWCLWHFPKLLQGNRVAIPFIIICFSMAIIYSWIWLKVEGNIFVLAIAHGSFDAVEMFFESNTINRPQGNILLQGWSILSIICALIAGLIFIITRNNGVSLMPGQTPAGKSCLKT